MLASNRTQQDPEGEVSLDPRFEPILGHNIALTCGDTPHVMVK